MVIRNPELIAIRETGNRNTFDRIREQWKSNWPACVILELTSEEQTTGDSITPRQVYNVWLIIVGSIFPSIVDRLSLVNTNHRSE